MLRSGTEMLAWAGAQIYCHCSLDESRVQFAAIDGGADSTTAAAALSASSIASRGTSFDPSKSEAGHVVFATTPKILFCGLSLQPNESKTFTYQERIPHHVPPSYYGSAVKYLYKLTIGTQRVKSGVQMLKIPLRILSPSLHPGPADRAGSVDSLSSRTHQLDSTTTNGGCSSINKQQPREESLEQLSEEERMELLIHRLECLTSRRSPSSYVITNACGQVARFSLHKSSFKLGEDVVGVFDFAQSVVPCVQVSMLPTFALCAWLTPASFLPLLTPDQFSVTLQSEEVIAESCKSGSSRSSSGGASISSHSRHHDFCLHTEQTQVILPIPLTVTPAFRTNIVSLSWRLHFEFVTTKADHLVPQVISDSQGFMTKAASHLDVQTMVWDLPLTIYPNHPVQVARGLQMPASSTILV